MFEKRLNFISFAGIKIGIDFSWFFIAILLSWTLAEGNFPYYYPGLSTGTYWLMAITGMLGLFLCILLHELGHAIVAKHYKLPVEQITLFIFGGIAEIKKEPPTPKAEFFVAIAGPIVSLFIAGAMYGLTILGTMQSWSVMVLGITTYLTWINVLIVVFNMIPAFPLDGGRVFRSILWGYKKNLAWATKISTRIGAAFGLVLIFLGIFLFITGNLLSGIWMAIIGLFLRKAATSSQTQFYIGKELKKEKVFKFMRKKLACVPPDISIQDFIDKHVYTSHHHLYPVIQEDKLLGYISLQEVKNLQASLWEKTAVKTAMIPLSKLKTISPDLSALEALNIMYEQNAPTLLVTENNQLVGLLTSQDLFKIILLKIELEETGY